MRHRVVPVDEGFLLRPLLHRTAHGSIHANASSCKSKCRHLLHSNDTNACKDKHLLLLHNIPLPHRFYELSLKYFRFYISRVVQPLLWRLFATFSLFFAIGSSEIDQVLAEEALVSPSFGVRVSSHGQLIAMASEATNNGSPVILDYANVLSGSKVLELEQDLKQLESNTSWKVRILTTSESAPPVSQKSIRDLWNPDDKTIIVIENISSPNVLNFNVGEAVRRQLPRQFFNQLQSRFGNQFFVRQEGEAETLLVTLDALKQCLTAEGGCTNVPGLTNDLYFLTLATSIVGGCVFGFAARLPPSGRVQFSWQWPLIFSPLWLLLFGSFGILPILGRTSDWEPLIKNTIGFLLGAGALYLTPIFGPSPITKSDE
ncbi:hypothetical protein O6H91_Y363000 [Diphasiastrum complanatum]|nr:hypothetical protein O6H91_Y363000 [Diphasiastrum complanatum]